MIRASLWAAAVMAWARQICDCAAIRRAVAAQQVHFASAGTQHFAAADIVIGI